jgi:hypothetical protein
LLQVLKSILRLTAMLFRAAAGFYMAFSWSNVMTYFAQSNQFNQTDAKSNRYHAAILLACLASSIVFLIAICLVSTSPDGASELAAMAVPP